MLAYLRVVSDSAAAGRIVRRSTPQMLDAVSPDRFVELMIVTAVALFFSTFSTPDALGGVHVRVLWVVGHFNADLRKLQPR
ncbi:MAG: hypothetical protein QM736_21410 [Vicinamibacterales bacterium]